MEKKKQKKFKSWLLIIPLIILQLFISCFGLFSPLVANAVTVTGYTGVLSDLKIDDNFNEEDFPVNSEDTSLQVIQVAESTGGELFIYTYQPSAKEYQFKLTTVSISQYLGDNASWKLYDLKLLDSDGVFAKYKVKGIELKSDVMRFYSITEIHREFNEDIDVQPDNGNTITEIAINVSKYWSVCTIQGETYYNCTELETVEITAKYVGFVRYKSSDAPTWIDRNSVDSHFVAFSCNYNMDKLLEADVFYTKQNARIYSKGLGSDKFSEKEDCYVTLTATSKTLDTDNNTTILGSFFEKYNYEYKEIETVDEFFSNVEFEKIYQHGIFETSTVSQLTEDAKSAIQEMQYVLRFDATDYIYTEILGISPGIMEEFTIIEDVTILRLMFELDGVVYNLGVVDNKTNGTGIPDNIVNWSATFSEEFKQVMKIIGYILLVIIIVALLSLLAVFTPIFKLVGKGLLVILKVVWWVLSSPIYLFKNKK